EDFVLRRLEPTPHRLALRTRRERNLLPPRLQLAHAAARRIEILLGLERLHLLAQLFLHLEVRPPLPLVRVPQLLHARGELRACRLEAGLQFLSILLGRERRPIIERRPDVSQRAIAGLQRDLFCRGERFHLPRNLLQPFEVVLLVLLALLLVVVLPLLARRNRLLQPCACFRIGRQVLAQHVGIAAQPAPPRHNLFERLRRRQQLFELGGERLEAPGSRLRQHPAPLALLERPTRILEPPRQRRRIFRRHRRQPVPAHLQLRDSIDRVVAGPLLDLVTDCG